VDRGVKVFESSPHQHTISPIGFSLTARLLLKQATTNCFLNQTNCLILEDKIQRDGLPELGTTEKISKREYPTINYAHMDFSDWKTPCTEISKRKLFG
jgi:hypothetical protein